MNLNAENCYEHKTVLANKSIKRSFKYFSNLNIHFFNILYLKNHLSMKIIQFLICIDNQTIYICKMKNIINEATI